MDEFAPIKGKCQFWREQMNLDDRYMTSIKKEEKRVTCTCFVEGDMWVMKAREVPGDCPKRYACRYYIRAG